MKSRLHSSHIGTESCLRRARECLFWSEVSAEMRELVAQCETCAKLPNLPNQSAERDIDTALSTFPTMAEGCCRSIQVQQERLHDHSGPEYFSNYWELDQLNSSIRPILLGMEVLKSKYRTMGLSLPRLSSPSSQPRLERHTSSPGHHKSNEMAESAVKTAKRAYFKRPPSLVLTSIWPYWITDPTSHNHQRVTSVSYGTRNTAE